MTAITADPFAGLDTFGTDTDAMADRFAEIVADITPKPEQARCIGCDRPIKSKISIARGYGKGCWAKAHRRDRIATLTADYTPTQVADAVELVEDGGVIHLRGRVFLTVGHKGDIYRTTSEIGQCSCKAGLRSIHCLHTAAVRLISAPLSLGRAA
ncbi:hypothetical protein [Frankia sp. AgW1.1]|uniref:hypothetical protein n=1 Tax=Frankia sp. AgW1.1 TaxID=1836971 RepID=UPI001932A97C|nr:hypothetical protein [Frankia sp. AgW1.1]MBL7487049.1 hypothetical protein [Frankia sp. AgW1.1]